MSDKKWIDEFRLGDGSPLNDEEIAAIQSAIADAIPININTPTGAFRAGYNRAIDELTTNLKAKGLLR